MSSIEARPYKPYKFNHLIQKHHVPRSNLTQLLIFELVNNMNDAQSFELIPSNSESESSETTNMFDVVDETLEAIDDLTTENSMIDSFETNH